MLFIKLDWIGGVPSVINSHSSPDLCEQFKMLLPDKMEKKKKRKKNQSTDWNNSGLRLLNKKEKKFENVDPSLLETCLKTSILSKIIEVFKSFNR